MHSTAITHGHIEDVARALEGLAERLRGMEPDRAVGELDSLRIYLETLCKAQKQGAHAQSTTEISLRNIATLADGRSLMERMGEERRA